jgi:hypothetical protein
MNISPQPPTSKTTQPNTSPAKDEPVDLLEFVDDVATKVDSFVFSVQDNLDKVRRFFGGR